MGTPEDKRGIDVLITCMNDRFPGVRRAAADALGHVGAEVAESASLALCQCLTDREWEVRAAALSALTCLQARPTKSCSAAKHGHRSYVLDVVRKCVEDEEATIRRDAAVFLSLVSSDLAESTAV